jgi:serine/threonine protein kinase
VLIDFVITRAGTVQFATYGVPSPGGVGQRWTTERRESRFGFKLLQSERQRCSAFRGMLRRVGRGRMNRSIDTRSDLYSLCVTLYQMLTGALPFAAADPLELAHSHIARQPTPAQDGILPMSLQMFLLR